MKQNVLTSVTPVKTGVQIVGRMAILDSGLRRNDGGGVVLWLFLSVVFAAVLALTRASVWAAGIEAPELSGADMSPDAASDLQSGMTSDFGLGQEPNVNRDALDAAAAPDLNRFGMSAPLSDASEESTSGGVMGPGSPSPTRILGTGQLTSGNEGFSFPGGVAVDGHGNVYVADTHNRRVQIFDAQGNFMRTLGTGQETSGNEGVRYPWSTAIDGHGNVYVADVHNHRVQIFDAQGNYLRTLGTGQKTSNNEGFNFPWSVAIDGEGKIHVADCGNRRVQIFDAGGHYLRTLVPGQKTSGNEDFNPRGITIDGEGNVYVTDANNHRVQVFDAQGNHLRTLGTGQMTSGNKGFRYPYNVAVDDKGNVYVADTHNHRVQIFNARGNYQRTLGTGQETSGNKGFRYPYGVAVDNVGKIYVADSNNHRVVIFPSIVPSKERLKRLKQELGRTVKQVDWDGDGNAAGERFKIWDSSLRGGKP